MRYLILLLLLSGCNYTYKTGCTNTDVQEVEYCNISNGGRLVYYLANQKVQLTLGDRSCYCVREKQ